jgi:hypothetical protein
MLIVGSLMLNSGLLLIRPIPLIAAMISPTHNEELKVTESLCPDGEDFSFRDHNNAEVDVTDSLSLSLCLDNDDFNLSCINSIGTQNTNT